MGDTFLSSASSIARRQLHLKKLKSKEKGVSFCPTHFENKIILKLNRQRALWYSFPKSVARHRAPNIRNFPISEMFGLSSQCCILMCSVARAKARARVWWILLKKLQNCILTAAEGLRPRRVFRDTSPPCCNILVTREH
jgi:hypothetical protein